MAARRTRFFLLLICILFSGHVCKAMASSKPFGLIYVQANTGGASGGHCGLRIGDEVYHLQQQDDGFFRLVRQPWGQFLHVYNDIENRPLFFAKTHLSPEKVQALEEYFLRLLLAQERNFENLRSLKGEVEFWEKLIRGGPYTLFVPGLGLYSSRIKKCPFQSEMVRVKKRILREFGPDFISKEKEALKKRALSLYPESLDLVLPSSKKQLVPQVTPFSKRISEFSALYFALKQLDQGACLKREVLVDAGPLEASFKEVLKEFSKKVEASIVSLLGSKRPDRGYAILVQMARLLAIQESIRQGHLFVLDTFPEPCSKVEFENYKQDLDGLRKILRDLENSVYAFQKELSIKKDLDEPAYTRLENLVSRYVELKRALVSKKAVRILEGLGIPEKGQVAEIPWKLDFLLEGERLKGAKRALNLYRERLKGLYSYNLIERNCVTELVGCMKMFSGAEGLGVPEATPIPFIYFTRWVKNMDVEEVEFYPGFRIRRLEKMYMVKGRLAYFREFNTLTSSIYHPHPADTSFLLFTDDVFLLRPIYGGINAAFGAANMLFGAAWLPFDRGCTFLKGFWGLVYSVPELFFANIRKGSFVYVGSNNGYKEGPKVVSRAVDGLL